MTDYITSREIINLHPDEIVDIVVDCAPLFENTGDVLTGWVATEVVPSGLTTADETVRDSRYVVVNVQGQRHGKKYTVELQVNILDTQGRTQRRVAQFRINCSKN